MNAQRLILQTLEDSYPRAVAERTLQAEVNLMAPETVTLSDLRHELGELEAKAQVVSIRSEDRDAHEQIIRKWRITDNGRARLRE